MPEIRINNFTCRYDISISENEDGREMIIFINGIASPLESWNQIRAMLNGHYKTIAYDLRGQWFSKVTTPPYSFAQAAADLKALMESQNIAKAHIVGTSLGGEIGMWFALLYPEMTQSLVVIASVSEIDPLLNSQVDRWRTAAANAVLAYDHNPKMGPEQTGRLGRDFFDSFMPDVFSNAFIKNNARIIEIQRNYYQEKTNCAYFQGFVHLCDMFRLMLKDELLTGKLHKIPCPALVIAGGQDIVKLPRYSQIIAHAIPNAGYVVIPDAGHTVAIEKPGMIAGFVQGFLSSHFPGKN